MRRQYVFNPFGKDVEDLTTKDLENLTDVNESWYVDYKQMNISIKKIAKHMSAFSNQYGGWLIFGVEESDRQTAGSFIGLNDSEVKKLLINLREACTVHSNPEVFYVEKVIKGQRKKIGLKKNRSILVIYIPEGKNPPYIHSSGKIYRRVSDKSEPEAEKDRYMLERLWRKKDKYVEIFKKIIEKNYTAETVNPIVYINLFLDPFFECQQNIVNFDKFKLLLGGENDKFLNIPMDTFYPSEGGYIARQSRNNNPMYPVLSFRWWHQNFAQIIIPFNIYNCADFQARFYQSDIALEFYSELMRNKYESAKICDVRYFFLIFILFYRKFINLLLDEDKTKTVYCTICIEKIFNVVPFLNDPLYLNKVKTNGIPVISDRIIQLPANPEPDNLIKIDNTKVELEDADSGKEFGITVADTILITNFVFQSFGLIAPGDSLIDYKTLYDSSMFN